MSERNNLTFVEDMIEAIDKILRYLETVEDYQEFSKSDMVIDAVTRNYEIIGEAAKHINDEIKINILLSLGDKCTVLEILQYMNIT